jgi:hypothetical protein
MNPRTSLLHIDRAADVVTATMALPLDRSTAYAQFSLDDAQKM